MSILSTSELKKVYGKGDNEVRALDGVSLAEPERSKCAYFIILSDQEGALDFLSSLFFSFLFIKLIRYADSRPNGQCKVPVNIVLDEFRS